MCSGIGLSLRRTAVRRRRKGHPEKCTLLSPNQTIPLPMRIWVKTKIGRCGNKARHGVCVPHKHQNWPLVCGQPILHAHPLVRRGEGRRILHILDLPLVDCWCPLVSIFKAGIYAGPQLAVKNRFSTLKRNKDMLTFFQDSASFSASNLSITICTASSVMGLPHKGQNGVIISGSSCS